MIYRLEYAINILDLLKSLPCRIVLTDSLPDLGEDSDTHKTAENFLVRHVVPEAPIEQKSEIVRSIEQIVKDEKQRTLSIPSESEQTKQQFYVWKSDVVIGRSYEPKLLQIWQFNNNIESFELIMTINKEIRFLSAVLRSAKRREATSSTTS